MSRTNIFDLLKQNNNISRDTNRMLILFNEYIFAAINKEAFTLYRFVDEFCFDDWSGKGRCLDIQDFLETLGIRDLEYYCPTDIDGLLMFIEILYNFWYLATNYIKKSPIPFERFDTETTLQKYLDECLSDYNHKAYYYTDKEKCIIIEDLPQITAAAEATDGEISIEIVRYHHRQLAGDILQKKAILKTLGDYLEGRKTEIQRINNSLYNCITGALNNLNIRHNNVNPQNIGKYKKAVADMPQEDLEAHYDDLYQLILLAIIEIDNVSRLQEMKTLIQRINEKETQ